MNQLLPDFIQPQPDPDEVALIRSLAQYVVAQPIAADIPGLVPMLADILVTGSLTVDSEIVRVMWRVAKDVASDTVMHHLITALFQLSADDITELQRQMAHPRRDEWNAYAAMSLNRATLALTQETKTTNPF
jgi:hypothetical protein